MSWVLEFAFDPIADIKVGSGIANKADVRRSNRSLRKLPIVHHLQGFNALAADSSG